VIRITRVRITRIRIIKVRVTGGATVLQGFAFDKFAMYGMASCVTTNVIRSVNDKVLRNYIFLI